MEVEAIVKEAEKLEKDVRWSMTSNFQIATWWRALHWLIGIPSVAASAATGVEAVKSSADRNLLMVLAVAAAVLSALSTLMNPQRTAREFHNAGVRYNVLMGKLRRFSKIDAMAPGVLTSELRTTLEALADEKAHLMQTSPHTGGFAYWLALRSQKNKDRRRANESKP